MGQNNDPTERGELQGNQGGYLSKDPREHEKLRAKDDGYPSTKRSATEAANRKPAPRKPG